MRKSKFSESQIVGILNEVEAGLKVVSMTMVNVIEVREIYLRCLNDKN